MADKWERTLRQVLDFAKRERGIEPVFVHGPSAEGLCVELDGVSYPLPRGLGEDAVLPLDYLRGLCRFLGLPTDDFGLDPEEED
jgi:hypothetical protein